jgi:putative heme iron utilization protein
MLKRKRDEAELARIEAEQKATQRGPDEIPMAAAD